MKKFWEEKETQTLSIVDQRIFLRLGEMGEKVAGEWPDQRDGNAGTYISEMGESSRTRMTLKLDLCDGSC